MIEDFDRAYSNVEAVRDAADYPPRWAKDAETYRTGRVVLGKADLSISVGADPRQSYDLFWPDDAPRGLFVFIHGGYWRRFFKDDFSHFAAGAVARGYAVAMVGYRLAPTVSISAIARDCAAAIADAANRVDGPVVLSGHSAGGHLVARLICGGGLPDVVLARIGHVLSVSGVHDLRPLLKTQMNADFRLDRAEAVAESPVLLTPDIDAPMTFAVGADELPEFIRQTDVIAALWQGLGLDVTAMHVPDTHHFNVIDGLRDPESPLLAELPLRQI